MKRRIITGICLILCAAFALPMWGCEGGTEENGGLLREESQHGDTVMNLTASRTPAPISGSVDKADAIVEFSVNLLEELMDQEQENIVFSPLSAYFALAMAYNGAAGDTQKQFEALLGLSREDCIALCAGLTAQLEKTENTMEIAFANSVWINDVYEPFVKENWLDTVKAAMEADVYRARLSSKETLKQINAWVKEKTRGLIQSMREEPYEERTAILLINALYFKAKWKAPFSAEATHKADFTLADGSTVKVDMMAEYGHYRSYILKDGVRGAILPYDDGRTAFVALLPEEGQDVRDFARSLTARQLRELCLSAEPIVYMNLMLPKFTAETSLNMNEILINMGLVDAFQPGVADLSLMGKDLSISSVDQKVKLIVDEKGTEAAAVTAVEVAPRSALPPADEPIVLTFDRPFAYAVIDLASGVPMFMGVMENPDA